MFRRTFSVVTLIAVSSLATSQAQAQKEGSPGSRPTSRPQLSEAVRAKAAKRFANGTRLFNDGVFADARADFEAAYRLTKAWQVLFYVGLCFSREKRYVKAVSTLERYLAHGASSPTSTQRKRALFELERLRGLLGHVRIKVNVNGAEIRVGQRVLGRSPLRQSVALTPEAHVVEVRERQHATARQRVELAPGERKELTFTLVRKQTMLNLASVPPGAKARLDGKDAGATPLERRLPVGDYQLELRRAGYAIYRTRLTLEPDQPRALTLHLDKLPTTPWYKRWYIWTVAGAVVAGAVITGVALALSACPADVCTAVLPQQGK